MGRAWHRSVAACLQHTWVAHSSVEKECCLSRTLNSWGLCVSRPGNMLAPKAHARGPFAEKPTQERRFCMKKGTGTRKFNDSLLLFRNTGDPVTFSLFGPSPVPAMGLISCDVYSLCSPDGQVSHPFGRYAIDTTKPPVPTLKGHGAQRRARKRRLSD